MVVSRVIIHDGVRRGKKGPPGAASSTGPKILSPGLRIAVVYQLAEVLGCVPYTREWPVRWGVCSEKEKESWEKGSSGLTMGPLLLLYCTE